MKKEIRTVLDGIVQVTIADERWYVRSVADPVTGLPASHEFVPSVTWIAGYYPKGIGFYKWLAQKGWDEAEAIRAAAGDKGSKVHQAIVDLVDGKTVPMSAQYRNPTTEQDEELTLEEYQCLVSFRAWWAEARPAVLLRERVVWNAAQNYAGTLDLLAELAEPKGLWLLDVKTSAHVWPEHEIQVSAYKPALLDSVEGSGLTPELTAALSMARLGILQVGYRQNRRGWKLTEVEDQFDLFLAARRVWEKETAGQEPFKADYPLELTLPTEFPPDPDPAPITEKRRPRSAR